MAIFNSFLFVYQRVPQNLMVGQFAIPTTLN